jgi:hypothetical protein
MARVVGGGRSMATADDEAMLTGACEMFGGSKCLERHTKEMYKGSNQLRDDGLGRTIIPGLSKSCPGERVRPSRNILGYVLEFQEDKFRAISHFLP